MRLPRIVVGGTHSGVGKTSVAIGLMGAFTRKGRRVQGFKIGPDFLDTSFHTAVTKRPSRNLDSWMIPKRRIPLIFIDGCNGADMAVIEGVMGIFDGLDGKSELASTSEVAKTLEAPVILVVDAYGLAGSAAAVVLGYRNLDPQLRVGGVILNRVAGDAHAAMCRDAIARHSDVPVLGAIPADRRVALDERHLGLVPSGDVKDEKVLDNIIDLVEASVDLDQVEALAHTAGDLPPPRRNPASNSHHTRTTSIAVARDRAFRFYYQENLDRLLEAGAQLNFFSPLVDTKVPEGTDGIYIGGGYPEVYASELSKNQPMLKSILNWGQDGMPIYAECGGLMYLTRSVQDVNGAEFSTVGLFDGKSSMVKSLTLSYTLAKSTLPNILTPAGKTVRGHEYHYSALTDVPQDAVFVYEMKRGRGIRDGKDGWASYNILGSYMHTNFASDDRMAKRLVDACIKYSKT